MYRSKKESHKPISLLTMKTYWQEVWFVKLAQWLFWFCKIYLVLINW